MRQPTNRSLRLPQPFSFWFQCNLSLKSALILRTFLADILHPGHNQFEAFLLQLTMSLVLCPSYYAASCTPPIPVMPLPLLQTIVIKP
jgi:hypothetical protein